MPEQILVALAKCASYGCPELDQQIGSLLDNSSPKPAAGTRILVKPNLLLAKELACTNPAVTAAVCKWLMDNGCKITIGDSPAFGSAQSVARAISLCDELRKLGLAITPFNKTKKIALDIEGQKINIGIAAPALETDAIFSVARVKAHSQMRMTLCVKNCFGVVPGMRKALLHALYGTERQFFAYLISGIWRALPPVFAVLDGIVAMHITGPSNGAPYQLGLLGSSSSAPLLDNTILDILHINQESVPLANCAPQNLQPCWPMLEPKDFHADNFKTPVTLKSSSFNPLQLLKSCSKRFWKKLLN